MCFVFTLLGIFIKDGLKFHGREGLRGCQLRYAEVQKGSGRETSQLRLAAVDRIKRDGQFGDRFAEQGLESGLYDLMRVFDAMYSLKSGCIVGYSYPFYDNGLLRIGDGLGFFFFGDN